MRQQAGAGRQTRVLVFEDDEIDAEACARVLRAAGYDVKTAGHFTTALAVLEAAPSPDVLVADIVVPQGGVNGMALARMARIRCPHIKVIHVSGFDLAAVGHELLGPVLRKPVDAGALVMEIERLLAE